MHGLGFGEDELIQEGLSYFPDCYSQSFDDCISERPSIYPNCARLNELWVTGGKDPVSLRLKQELAKLPFCEEPSNAPKYAIMAIAVVASFAVGFAFAKAR